MATVNRFTQFKPAQYTPYSLQEMMLAPQYMRQQHDAMLESYGAADTQIAQTDYNPIHADVAGAEQQRLFNLVNEQVDFLNNEGFNPASKAKLINLNKEYQRSISPTGVLGRAAAAKASIDESKKASEQAVLAANFSGEDFQRNWANHMQEYIDKYEATGEIANMETLLPPRYVDAEGKFMEYASAAGYDADSFMNGEYKIVTDDPRGVYVLNTKTGRQEKTNDKNLVALVDYFKTQASDPNSDLSKSVAFQNKDMDTVLKGLGFLSDAATIKDVNTVSETSANSFKAAKNTNMGGAPIIATSKSYIKEDMPTNNYAQLLEESSKLENLWVMLNS